MNGDPVEHRTGRLDDGTEFTVARYHGGRMSVEIAGTPFRYALAALDSEELEEHYASTRMSLVRVDAL